MSQVGVSSRPASHQSGAGRPMPALPEIQHPLSRLGNPENLGVRGVSRTGDRPGTQQSLSGRPLANEATYGSPRRSIHSSAGRASRISLKDAREPPPTVPFEAIPEGVEVTQGDPTKTRLPVFGNRAELGSRGELASRGDAASRAMSRMSRASSQSRLEIDELEAVLKERVKSGFHELKKKFKDNDPEGKGNVSREALFRIVVTTLKRPINQPQFNKLMDRLGIKDRIVVGFTDFFACFRDVASKEYPRWMDPVHHNWQERATMNASQVHLQLKERARQRVRDIADLIPQTNPDGSGHILKPEFRNVLNKMGFWMDDDEFEKLWTKYDAQGCGTINGEKMMAKLGISIKDSGFVPTSPLGERQAKSADSIQSGPRRKEADRKRSLDIERWLKRKFREGFNTMRASFEAFDHDRTGAVSHDEFLEVLSEFGLKLEKEYLADFLARCSVDPSKTNVPYRDFLHRFQDRSDKGMAHNVLTNSKHRYNRTDSPGGKSTLSALETQLLNMFQRDFLSLLGVFHKIDRFGTDLISQEEFRAAIESRFGLEMTDEQFSMLVDKVPLNEEGNVKYADFMAQFDTRGKAPSLFQGVAAAAIGGTSPPPARVPTPPGTPPSETPAAADRLVVHDDALMSDVRPHRSTHELFKLIKDLLKKQYQAVEEAFHDLDEQNTRRLSQETMFQLLKRFDIQPEISRGEIRDIWKTFITNVDKTLDFQQFTRHFGYSLKSAAFANAKISPPKRGDCDFMIKSRKLNCAADMLQDGLRSKIDYMWEDLRKEFVEMDPYSTGCVNADEFKDVLTELCIHLSDYELEMLTRRFEIQDGRVSYIEFLKPFAMKRQVWRHGNNMLSLLQHSQPELPITDIVEPPHKGLHGISAKLRQKLSGDWKNLRRAFKKMDTSNTGYLSLPEFRSVLKLANVLLDEDEVYHVMTQFDEDMSGRIPYQKFLNDTFRPAPQPHPLRKSANI